MKNSNGKYAEQLFYHMAKEKGFKVIDVSRNPDYWDKDIDFIVQDQKGEQRTYEVKEDSRIAQTQNLFIETWNANSKEQKGWLYFTQADWLMYLDSKNLIFYQIKMQDIRQICAKQKLRVANCGQDSQGFLLSLSIAEKLPSFRKLVLKKEG